MWKKLNCIVSGTENNIDYVKTQECILTSRVGFLVGAILDGSTLRVSLGTSDGLVLGTNEGIILGSTYGELLGSKLGAIEGIKLGLDEGTELGSLIGDWLGWEVGTSLGSPDNTMDKDKKETGYFISWKTPT